MKFSFILMTVLWVAFIGFYEGIEEAFITALRMVAWYSFGMIVGRVTSNIIREKVGQDDEEE